MSRRKRIGRAILTALTYAFAGVIHRQKITAVDELDLLDDPVTVYTIQKDSPMFAQSILLIGTILVNESRWEGLSDRAKRCVLHHELSHSTRTPLFRGLFLGMLFCSAVAARDLLMAAVGLATGRYASIHFWPALILLSVIVIFVGLVRIEETIADQHALDALGVEEFRKAYDELLGSGGGSTGGVVRAILYTTPEASIRLYHFRKNVAATIRSSLP